jgi:LmbE family N-acetylglucosaminyl deacetylase
MSDELRNANYVPERAMVIVAHPDDIEFGCAGTLARWAQAGAGLCYVLCTSGDVGIDKPGVTRAQATEIREAEQRAAAEVVGVRDLVFLREPDGKLENTMALRKKLVREIRRFRPEVVMTFDPTVLWGGDTYINHPDHRAAGMAAVDAIFPAAGQPHVFEELADEGLTAHKVRKVYVVAFDPETANTVVDIGDTIELKVRALKNHASQLGDWDPEPMLREWSSEAAKDEPFEHGETYRVITLIGDDDWARIVAGGDEE